MSNRLATLYDVCKVRNYSKGNKLFLKVSGLAEAVMTRPRNEEQGSAKENAEHLCGFVYGGPVRTHERASEAMPLRSNEAAATSRIAEADTGKCQSVKVSPY
jgi:hypothetical protein